MTSDLGTAQLTITGDIEPLRRALVGARNETTRALEGAARDARLAGFALSAALTAPLLGMAGFAVKTELAFQVAFAGVEKSVEGSSLQIQKLRTDILQMSEELPNSAVEIANVAAVGGRLGVAVGNLENFTRVAIDLGNATDLSAEQAITGLTRLMNIVGTAPSRVREVADTLTYLGNAGASSGSEIINLALRLAATGKLIGLSENNVLGLANGLSSLGIRAEAGGSAFSRLFADIDEAVSTGSNKLDKFAAVAGRSRDSFSQLVRANPSEAILEFVGGLNKLDKAGGNVFATLRDLGLQNIRVRSQILTAATGIQTLTDSVRDASDASKTAAQAEEVASKVYDTDAARLSAFAHQVQVGAMAVGTLLLPTLLDVAAVGGPAIKGLIDLFNDMPGPLRVGVISAIAFGVALGPIALAFGTLASALSPALALFRFMILAATNFTSVAPKVAASVAEIKAAAAASASVQQFQVPLPQAPTAQVQADTQAQNARRLAANIASAEAASLDAVTAAQVRNAAATSASNAVIDAQQEYRLLNRQAMQLEGQAENLLAVAQQKSAQAATLKSTQGLSQAAIAAENEALVANGAAQQAATLATEARTAANVASTRVSQLQAVSTEANTAATAANVAVQEAEVVAQTARNQATNVATGAIARQAAVQGGATAATAGFSIASALAVGNLVLLGATIVGGIILWQKYAAAVKEATLKTEEEAYASRIAQGRVNFKGQLVTTSTQAQSLVDQHKQTVADLEARAEELRAFVVNPLAAARSGMTVPTRANKDIPLEDEYKNLVDNVLPEARTELAGAEQGLDALKESSNNAATSTHVLSAEEEAFANTARGTIPWISGLIEQYDKLDSSQRAAKLSADIAKQATLQSGKSAPKLAPLPTAADLAGLNPDEAAQAMTDAIRARQTASAGYIDIKGAEAEATRDYIATLEEEIAAEEEQNRIANTPEGIALRAEKKALQDLRNDAIKLTDEMKDFNTFMEKRVTARISAEVTDLPGLKTLAQQLKQLDDHPSKSAIGDYQKQIRLLDSFWNTVAVPALIAAGEAVDTTARETFEKVATTLLDGKQKIKNASEGISGYLADLYGRQAAVNLRLTSSLLDASRFGSVAGIGLGGGSRSVTNHYEFNGMPPDASAQIIRDTAAANGRVPFSEYAAGMVQ